MALISERNDGAFWGHSSCPLSMKETRYPFAYTKTRKTRQFVTEKHWESPIKPEGPAEERQDSRCFPSKIWESTHTACSVKLKDWGQWAVSLPKLPWHLQPEQRELAWSSGCSARTAHTWLSHLQWFHVTLSPAPRPQQQQLTAACCLFISDVSLKMRGFHVASFGSPLSKSSVTIFLPCSQSWKQNCHWGRRGTSC